MLFYSKLNDFQEKMFSIFVTVSYILIFVSFFGLSSSAPKYLDSLDYYVRIYICLFLLWRFNPLRKLDKFTDLDRKIAFSAGLFILTTTALNQYLNDITNKVLSKIGKKTPQPTPI
jgi:uncharacterized BrkB/YihY/UPF0761 family membrane protein